MATQGISKSARTAAVISGAKYYAATHKPNQQQKADVALVAEGCMATHRYATAQTADVQSGAKYYAATHKPTNSRKLMWHKEPRTVWQLVSTQQQTKLR